MFVPGIGLGSCDRWSALGRTCLEKSACLMSWRDGRPVPGVINPIRLPRCAFTKRIAACPKKAGASEEAPRPAVETARGVAVNPGA